MEAHSPQAFEDAAQVGQVELDRYCAGCGYNLRQQAVRREPTTALLLCKCPECGAYEPANQATTRQRSWFAQLVFLLWLAWVAALGFALFGAIGATAGLAYEAGELLNETKYLDKPIPDPRDTGSDSVRMIKFQYELGTLDGMIAMELFAYLLAAFFIAAGLLAVALLFIPHWPRKAYLLLALGWPIVALIAFFGMRLTDHHSIAYATSGLKLWIYLSPFLIVLFAVAGGLTAICLSRPIARLIVRMLIPQRQRGPFAFLWLVDGKTPPGSHNTNANG